MPRRSRSSSCSTKAVAKPADSRRTKSVVRDSTSAPVSFSTAVSPLSSTSTLAGSPSSASLASSCATAFEAPSSPSSSSPPGFKNKPHCSSNIPSTPSHPLQAHLFASKETTVAQNNELPSSATRNNSNNSNGDNKSKHSRKCSLGFDFTYRNAYISAPSSSATSPTSTTMQYSEFHASRQARVGGAVEAPGAGCELM